MQELFGHCVPCSKEDLLQTCSLADLQQQTMGAYRQAKTWPAQDNANHLLHCVAWKDLSGCTVKCLPVVLP